jgi:hypothetical protein
MKNKPSESNFKFVPGVASDFVSRAVAICLLLWASGAWASAAALEGIVRTPNGHPIRNAQIRIEAKSGKFAKTITTDAKGHYFCDGLTAGTDYKVTLVNGSTKAASASVRTQAGKPTELNLEWGLVEGSPKRHMIWVPQQTGTHIGSTNGSWVTVDETGRVVNDNAELTSTGAKQLGNGGTKNSTDFAPPPIGH